MNRPNTKEEVIQHLFQQFPTLKIDVQVSGYIIEIDNDIVYARITTEDDEEYDCELHKNIFPQEDLAENIYFFMVLGTINHKEFTHINYFYWTQEQIDKAKEQAEDLYHLLQVNTTKKA